jgi:hypothetical protein
MRIYRKILRSLFNVPDKELTWNVQDFKKAVSLLKRYDNPENKMNSLWDKMNNPWYDSVDVLHQANIIIRTNLQT